ncbi:MAG: DNA polymerase III subunit delta [Bacteroidia bacterium]|nr:DNA polymerase III subunit delta [Bacteroidia bacterium]MCZ2247630.1 DNA polymerase III subunit delta [Bacteroidia bacterium]
MPRESFENIIKSLKERKFAPIYFLEGEEPYYIDKIADYIENNVLDESEREFNQTVLYGKDTDLISLISAAKRFPMMADKQVIIVREAQEIKNLTGTISINIKSKNKKKETEISPLEEYVLKPLPSTVLVICYKYKTIDRRTSIAKSLDKNAITFLSEKVKDYKLAEWITKYIQQKNIKMNGKAVQMLADHIGNDLSRIVNELNKLIINKKEQEEISPDDIQQYIGISKDFNIFELQNAIAQKDILKANRIIDYFAQNPKEHPFEMNLAVLYTYFSKLLYYQSLPDKSAQAVMSQMKLSFPQLKDLETAGRNYSMEKLVRIIGYLHDYDMRGKGLDGIQPDKGELMREMLFKILH